MAFPAQDQPARAGRLSLTLSTYIAKHALTGVMIALLALGVIAVVIDLIELLRRASSPPDAEARSDRPPPR